MGKALYAAQGVGIAVFRLEHDARTQGLHQPALARHAELCFEIAADARDDLDAVLLHKTYLTGDRARGRGEIKWIAAAIVSAAATFCNFISASSG